MKQIFPGIWREGRDIFTENLIPGSRVYGEDLMKSGGKEYRRWDPTRSKLAAAIVNGLKIVPFAEGSKVLYLGASTGTTVSHISDIVKKGGIIYAVEFAEKPFRSLIDLAEKRKNIVPVLADARKPETYSWFEQVDIVFADLAQPDMTEITIRNAKEFLKPGGFIMLSVKARSIDVTKNPPQIWKEEARKFESAGFKVVDRVSLEPHEKDHAIIVAKSPA